MKTGDKVTWKWGNGTAEGTVKSVHTEPTSIKSNGSEIKRNGSADDPAVIIEQESGNDVLKLASELQKTDKNS